MFKPCLRADGTLVLLDINSADFKKEGIIAVVPTKVVANRDDDLIDGEIPADIKETVELDKENEQKEAVEIEKALNKVTKK